MDTGDEWTKLGSLLDQVRISEPVAINNDEFVVATSMSSYPHATYKFPGIWLYNIHNNTWKHIITYNKKIMNQIFKPRICYDQNNDQLYMYSETKFMLISMNLKSKEYNIINTNDKLNMQTFAPTMIFLNNIIHMTVRLNDSECLQHVEWDTSTNNTKIIHNFIELKDLGLCGFIHLKNRNQLMLIGGTDGYGRIFDDIYVFDMNKYKWNKLEDIKLPETLYDCLCMVSSNEKYLIVINGRNGDRAVNKIYILDLDIMKWKQCTILTPQNRRTKAILIDESLSINGLNNDNNMDLFINGLLRNLSIELYIPLDIISIFKIMYSKEIIHLLVWDTKNVKNSSHFSIDLDKVLQNSEDIHCQTN